MKFSLFPAIVLSLSLRTISFAGSATWNLSPTSGDWNTAANWTPATVPNAPGDVATFDLSNTAAVSVSRNTEVNGIVFNPNASAYTITTTPRLTLTISGAGITNSSTRAQSFVADADAAGNSGVILFSGSANAGSATTFATNGSPVAGKKGGRIQFSDDASSGNGIFTNGGGVDFEMTPGMTLFSGNSTADHSSFINEGAAVASAYGGITQFQDTASAGNGNFTNKGTSSIGGSTQFFGSSTAQDATFTNNTGGGLGFSGRSTADHAFIVNEGGTTSNAFGGSTSFTDDSGAGEATIIARGASGTGIRGFVGFESRARAENATLIATGGKNGGAGGEIFFPKFPSPSTARVELFGNGSLNFLTSTLTIGSLEGDGLVDGDSGMARLTIGTNNLSTFFEGTISGVVYLDKVGTGTLTLGNAINYTQVTTILDGALLVTHHHGSATGYGPVNVNGGILGGSGKIGGMVTVGTGQGLGATLSVGLTMSKPGLLTIQSQLTLQSDATCTIAVGNGKMTADKIVAKGITIASGALLTLVDLDGVVLDPGTSLKVISNTATTPISGTFTNLPNGATITAGNNTFQASYSGGDGNDLTLTVVP